jgi:hypothetical protein
MYTVVCDTLLEIGKLPMVSTLEEAIEVKDAIENGPLPCHDKHTIMELYEPVMSQVFGG